jgi:hypothetical protein
MSLSELCTEMKGYGSFGPSLHLLKHLRQCAPERPRQPVGCHDGGVSSLSSLPRLCRCSR